MGHLRNRALCAAVLLILGGCSIIRVQSPKDQQAAIPGSGLFRSTSRGEQWSPSGDLYVTDGKQRKLQFTDTTFFKFDPQDPQALYLGTNNGIYYSYNGGGGWFLTLNGKGVINDLAIDPRDKCTLIAAARDKLYKTTDCARTWELIHLTSVGGQFFTSVLISRADSGVVFAGTSTGSIARSQNGGASWEIMKYLDTPITRFMEHPNESAAFYVVTPKFGIQITRDTGATFTSLNQLPVRKPDGTEVLNARKQPSLLKDLSGTNTYYDLKFDATQKDGLIYVSAYGIFRLVNQEYWQEIEVLNKPREIKIYSAALDSLEGKSLYFATIGKFYRSDNGGQDWTIKQMPATGIPKQLLLVPGTTDQLFITFYAPPKK